MLPSAAVAARLLLPVSVSVVYVIYKYWRSGRQTESWVPPNRSNNDDVTPNSGNNGVVPPNSGNNDVVPCPELSDRDLAILEEILKDDPVLLYEIRTHDPAVINELRKFDPAVLREMVLDSAEVDPTIIDAIRKLCLKRKEEDEKEAKGSCSGRETESENENGNETQRQERDEEISRSRHYPLRPEAADCSYYLKTGTCKFRSNCKFNHPRTTTKNNQDHFWSGGRKDGRDGSFNPRSREPFAAPFVENFMGLPIRPGERDCPYYMRNLSCRYGLSCRFNHPDPTPAGESDPPSGYGNGGPASLQGASSSTAARWSAPRSQGIPSRNTEHNGYQQQQVEELPQRPGQPVCIYFSTTGDCKFKSNCKYHPPKNQTAVSPSCALNDKGLPLRPGQNICTQYSTYGICNSGPACKFDHPSL
ncbi:zinc finger CCCH domain-containing protein 43-like isoform X9 [Prunus dulcis]|uniref:zinc finger CCCH domain-containing protein 43-like isoform X9 n=1 Tax=Prunus dulcis TaxID=3755 RepID=UPI001483AA90|nr:zinc finger CCCH domain-containing protein 43-like isoform X9 [Prunus dulcis]